MPIVIAHRGASGYRPEHTLAAYELAARMGADYLEPDLVLTADGVLVDLHEPEIGGTTDVAAHPELAGRRTTKSLDGRDVTGWFAEDLTLAELKTLRARERIPELRPGSAAHDGRHAVPTFQEVVDLAARLGEELGRTIGVCPETKHPTYFARRGTPLEPLLVEALRANGLAGRDAPVIIQSFETGNLRALREQVDVRLLQLVSVPTRGPFDLPGTTYADLATPDGLREVATYADAVGPNSLVVVPREADGRSAAPTAFVDDAHAAGLEVHPYTFRLENTFLPLERRRGEDPAGAGDLLGELRAFYALGVDGVFADHPDVAVQAREPEAD